jgi:rSAM/selenodomain-associated transferase 2
VSATGAPEDTGAAPSISVIVPALDEEKAMESLVGMLAGQADPPPFEVILADGGSADSTVARFARAAAARLPGVAARIVPGMKRGRAVQMNAGAAAARGGILVFVHADTHLPAEGLMAIERALGRGAIGGGFRLAYRERHAGLALIAAWASTRSRLTGIHYGDQAMFVRRDRFFAIGGFPEVPLFEDRRFSARLRRSGRVVTLPLDARTSARRLIAGGIARTALRFAWLKLRHALGTDPAVLARAYRDVR